MVKKRFKKQDAASFYDVKYILPGGKKGVHRAYTQEGADDFAKTIEKKFRAMTWIKKI